MKVTLLLQSVAFAQFYSKCSQQAEKKRQNLIKRCKTQNIVASHDGDRSAARQWRNKLRSLTSKIAFEQRNLCRKAETIYEPAGLMDEIPAEWECPPRSPQTEEVHQKLKKQKMENMNPDADFNIVLVGMTGAGKSYFGNALLGELNPGRTQKVPFPSSASSDSMTQNVKVATGELFGGLYDRELGLDKSVTINVFDTPGFADANIDNIRKNKLLIASSLKNDIDMVIYLLPTDRIDQNNQMALKMLNEWTTGQLWSNLVLNKGRIEFDKDSIKSRCGACGDQKEDYSSYSSESSSGADTFAADQTYYSMKNKTDVVDILKKVQDGPDKWFKYVDDRNGNTRKQKLSERDFAKLELMVLNMAQHAKCLERRREQDNDCWQMPLYLTDYGETVYMTKEVEVGDYDYVSDLVFENTTSKYFFIEEAKTLLDNLRRMSQNKIKPVAQIYRNELKKDNERLKGMKEQIIELDEEQARQSEANSNQMLAGMEACEVNNRIKDSHCPRWQEWTEWTECAPDCDFGAKVRQRSCEKIENGGEMTVAANICEEDTSQKRKETELCTGLPKCPDETEDLRKLIKESKEKQQKELDALRKQQEEELDRLREERKQLAERSDKRLTVKSVDLTPAECGWGKYKTFGDKWDGQYSFRGNGPHDMPQYEHLYDKNGKVVEEGSGVAARSGLWFEHQTQTWAIGKKHDIGANDAWFFSKASGQTMTTSFNFWCYAKKKWISARIEISNFAQ